ncbi:MAG TPA: hypothetical protein VIO61_09735 [Anaerolineaceae bacterium]
MQILNVGPLELLFFFVIMFILLGPEGSLSLGKRIGYGIRMLFRSQIWREINEYSREIREIPTKLVRESGIDEAMAEVRATTTEAAAAATINTSELTADLETPGSLLEPPVEEVQASEPIEPLTTSETPTDVVSDSNLSGSESGNEKVDTGLELSSDHPDLPVEQQSDDSAQLANDEIPAAVEAEPETSPEVPETPAYDFSKLGIPVGIPVLPMVDSSSTIPVSTTLVVDPQTTVESSDVSIVSQSGLGENVASISSNEASTTDLAPSGDMILSNTNVNAMLENINRLENTPNLNSSPSLEQPGNPSTLMDILPPQAPQESSAVVPELLPSIKTPDPSENQPADETTSQETEFNLPVDQIKGDLVDQATTPPASLSILPEDGAREFLETSQAQNTDTGRHPGIEPDQPNEE